MSLFTPFSFIQAAAGAYVTDGLVGYWDANNASSYPGSGTTWTDLSGNGYNATATSTPSYTAASPSYFDFDETYQFKVVNATAATTTNGSHTWMAAVNVDTWANFQGILGTTDGGSVVAGTSRIKAQQISGQNRFAIQTWDGSANAVNSWAAVNYSTGTWYIIAGTQNWASPYGMETFVNNVSIGTATQASNVPNGALDTINIGNVTNTNNSDAYDGKMGFIMIYNKVLSSDELTQNYDYFKSTYGL